MRAETIALTGLVDPAAVHARRDRLDTGLIERLRVLADLSATVSDVLDRLDIDGVAGADQLRPTLSGPTVVGAAVTIRKVPRRDVPSSVIASGRADMGEIEGANQSRRGDVLVIEGQPAVSAMGGLMATMAQRQGAIGAVVDGGVRDIAHTRAIGFPLWSTHVTPVTGKWRTEVVEVGGTVTIAGIRVSAGDLVVADDTGVAFVPARRVGEVVEGVEEIARVEAGYHAALQGDQSLPELIAAARAAGQTP